LAWLITVDYPLVWSKGDVVAGGNIIHKYALSRLKKLEEVFLFHCFCGQVQGSKRFICKAGFFLLES
jgi:hypothetical protein